MGALKLTYYETKNPLKVVYSKSFEERKSVQRFLSVDPKPDAGSSVYSAFGNNPIINMDPLGDTLKPFTFAYLPVTGNTEGRNPIASGVENVFRFAYNNTIGAVAGLGAGAWNTVTNQSSNANTNIVHEFDKFQKKSFDYHTTTPAKQQLKDFGNIVTDLRSYDAPAQLLVFGLGVGSRMSYTGTLLKVETVATKGVTSPTGKFYSVAFETELASTSYPGVSRYMHFQEANVALDAAMKTNPMLGQLGIGVPRSAAGSIIGKSPTNWVWHHNVNKGVMQLVPKAQHPNIPGGIFWETMHPGGVGGYSIWGK